MVTIQFQKEENKLVYKTVGDEARYKLFRDNLQEGQLVEAYFEVIDDDASNGQLARVHAMIRELAFDTGTDFETMKLIVKDKGGLCIKRTIEGKELFECKSFGDCSRKQLTLAIEAAKVYGEELNISFPV